MFGLAADDALLQVLYRSFGSGGEGSGGGGSVGSRPSDGSDVDSMYGGGSWDGSSWDGGDSESRDGSPDRTLFAQLALVVVQQLPLAVAATRRLTAGLPPGADLASALASSAASMQPTGAAGLAASSGGQPSGGAAAGQPSHAEQLASLHASREAVLAPYEAHSQGRLLDSLLELAFSAPPIGTSLLPAYAAAALAALQLVPLVPRLQQEEGAAEDLCDSAIQLAEHLLRQVHGCLEVHGNRGVIPSALAQLWHAHQWVARLVHAGGDVAQCSLLPVLRDSQQLLRLLLVCYDTAWSALECMEAGSPAWAERSRRMEALVAAQVEALAALASRLSPRFIWEAIWLEQEQSGVTSPAQFLFSLLHGVAVLPRMRGLVPLAAELAASIAQCALSHQRASWVDQAYFDAFTAAKFVMEAALDGGEREEGQDSQFLAHVPAALFTSGTLSVLLEAAALLPMHSQQRTTLASYLHAILDCLCTEAAVIVQGTSAGQVALPPELATRLAAGQERVAALLKNKRTWLLRNYAAEVQPVAAELAAALQQYWQLPVQRAAAELDLATAASARSCAYLRCANLGAEGGPAAGEGVGSQRCSACRAVWYCGTACSHADWRQGGHRTTCKALTVARRGKKASAAQP